MDTPASGQPGVQAATRAGRLGAWICAALITLALTAAPALAQTTYFVDAAQGSDSNACTSAGAGACKTIGHAVSLAANGDTIDIAAGTYDEAVSTSLSNLSFVGAGSGADGTLIDSTTDSGDPALALSGTGESVSDLALQTNNPNVGGALNVSGSATVTATDIAVTTGADPVGPTQDGSDGIDFGNSPAVSPAPSLSVSDSTISVTNTDDAIANTNGSSVVVQDGSGIEDENGGVLSVTGTTIQAVRGIALRIRGGTTSTTVRDSLLESSGVEDYTNGETDYEFDQWPVLEAGSGTVAVHDSTIYNATVGVINQTPSDTSVTPTEYGRHADGVWVPDTSGGAETPAAVTIENTVLYSQPTTAPSVYGADIDTGVPVTVTDSAYTTVATEDIGAVTGSGEIAGDPGFDDPASGDFGLAAGSALLGAGDSADDLVNELDLAGNPRTTACAGAAAVTNIGALESPAASCPAALSSGDSTGALTQLSGAGNCITGDTAANTGCGTASVPGMTGGTAPSGSSTIPYDTAPTDTVQSPDGQNVYVATEDPDDNGVDIAELSRAGNGSLSELASPNNCVEPTGGTGGCDSTDGQLLYELSGSNQPYFEPTRMAISPDGTDLYVDNGNGIAEFSRNAATGALTPLGAADCIAWLSSSSCQYTDEEPVATAAAMVVSPNGDDLYVATLNQCSEADFIATRAAHAAEASTPPGDNQNLDCNNDPSDGFYASSDIAVLTRNPTTGVLTPSLCYDNSATPEFGQQPCVAADASGNDFDGLYGMTSMAISSDGKYLYVASDSGASSAGGTNPFGLLSRDPGEITELSVDPSTGALSQLQGSGACVTAGTGCGVAGDTGASEVPGVADPQQIVLSPDGLDAYVVGSQYTATETGNGTLVGTTLAQLTRDPNSGILTPISGATCFAGYHEACATANGPGPDVTQVPAVTGAEALAISPDGLNVYATAENGGVDSSVIEFSRDESSGELTPLSTPNLCQSNGSVPGASSPYQCSSSQPDGLSDSVSPLPGDVLVSPDCQTALVMSDGLAAFSRDSPGGSCLSTVAFSEPSLAFDAAPNATSASQTVTVTNQGGSNLVFGPSAVTLGGTDPGDFALTADSCSGQTVAPSATCTLSVDFSAPASGTFSADVLLADNAAGSPQSVALRGTAGAASISFSPASLAFGSASSPVDIGTSQTQFETISNGGSASLVLGALSLSGAQASRFAIASNGCSSQTLTAGGSCKLSITYTPTQAGDDSAQLDVSDNAAGSPQPLALSGVASKYPIEGTVFNASAAPATPAQGASIYACPENGSSTHGACTSATTSADGDYGLQVTPGTWLLQLTPPGNSGLFGGQAIVQVTAGHTTVQNFDLTPPTPLSGGIVVNGQTSGVPVVNWEEPISVQIPLGLPATGTPNTTAVFMFITGLTGAGSSGSDSGFNLAGLSMFGIHYGSNGLPDAVGPSFSTQVDCTGTPSPCAAPLSTTSLTGTTGGTARDARRAAAATRHTETVSRAAGGSLNPIAHVAGCPPAAVNTSIMPGELNTIPTSNGVHFVMDFGAANGQWDLGTASTYQPPQFAPPPVDPDFPIASAALALPGKAVNMMANAVVAPYNSWVQQTQDLATAQRVSDPALAQQLNSNAVIDMSLDTLGASAHGATEIVQKALVGMVQSDNTADNAITINGLLDCPPKSASTTVDPSGTVTTTTGIPVAGAKVVLTRSGTAKGKQTQVPNGSEIMSASNRRNPDHTSALGVFHWDVVPGYYQIRAGRSGCRAVKGPSLLGFTPVLAVPPPRKNLSIRLRCPHLKRSATKLTLRLGSKSKVGALVWASLKLARGGRSIPEDEAPGEITFAIKGVGTRTLPLIVRHGWVFYDLPLTSKKIKLLSASFSGNGYLLPSSARLKNP